MDCINCVMLVLKLTCTCHVHTYRTSVIFVNDAMVEYTSQKMHSCSEHSNISK